MHKLRFKVKFSFTSLICFYRISCSFTKLKYSLLYGMFLSAYQELLLGTHGTLIPENLYSLTDQMFKVLPRKELKWPWCPAENCVPISNCGLHALHLSPLKTAWPRLVNSEIIDTCSHSSDLWQHATILTSPPPLRFYFWSRAHLSRSSCKYTVCCICVFKAPGWCNVIWWAAMLVSSVTLQGMWLTTGLVHTLLTCCCENRIAGEKKCFVCNLITADAGRKKQKPLPRGPSNVGLLRLASV